MLFFQSYLKTFIQAVYSPHSEIIPRDPLPRMGISTGALYHLQGYKQHLLCFFAGESPHSENTQLDLHFLLSWHRIRSIIVRRFICNGDIPAFYRCESSMSDRLPVRRRFRRTPSRGILRRYTCSCIPRIFPLIRRVPKASAF